MLTYHPSARHPDSPPQREMARQHEDPRDRGRDGGSSGYRHADSYDAQPSRSYGPPPRSPYNDYESRRRYSSRSPVRRSHPRYSRSVRDSRSGSPSKRDQDRRASAGSGAAVLRPRTPPPALLGRLDHVPPRSDHRASDTFSSKGEKFVSRTDPREHNGTGSTISTFPPRPLLNRIPSKDLDNSREQQVDARSVPKSANVATSQRPPLGHTDVNKHNFPASNTTSARPSEMTPAITQPEASSSTDPSAGPNSSLGGRPSISTASSSIDPSAGPNSSNGGRPSISAASGSKPASAPGQNPTASTHKQAESRTKRSRSSSRPKDSAARSEQEDKSGTGTRTGSGHSAKGKGKATAYNPRVDPAVLNLVKANFALYNAEAMVDKYRLEALELEKTFGMPVKEMTPGDQQQMKQLLTEFGQHRDSAKKERDSVILSFERTLHPYLYRYLEGMLKELLPAHLAKAKPVIETHNGDDVVEPSNQMDMETTQAPLADESSTETQSKPVAPSASEIQTEPLPQNIVMTGLSSESPVKTIQDKIPASNSAAELADTNMIHHALNMAENPVSMEVDTDKPNETSSVLPVKFVKDVQESVSLLDGHVQSKQPNGASVQAVDDLPENKQDRRKLVGERLKVLENGFKEAATTTEELGRKLEKLEEQVANQEEQLYEYLNTQALSNEGRADAAIASLNSSGNPLAEAKDEALIGRTTPPAHNIDEAILETARAEAVRTLEARLSDWSRAQDLRITEIAKAHETRLATVRDEIRAEIRTEAARAEEAYASAIQTAEEKATKLESQLSALQAELLAFKEERKVIERLKEHQNTSDQLVKTIRESTLKAQLTESQFRNGVNAKLGEIETRVTTHDSQMKDMSTFENTKEAWRKDMIDMKNHVIGRVDYLEEQVQSLKQPLMAARSNDQLPQPAASPLAEQLAVAQTTRENSGVRSPALQPPQMTTQQVPQRQSQTNQMLSQYTPTSIPIPQQSSGQTLPHIVNSDEGNQFTMQSARANSGEPSQVRLAINRGSGPLVNSVVPVSQSAAAPVSHSIQPSVFGQTWRPPFPGQSVSGQQSPGQPRLPSLQVDNEQAIYQPRAVPAGARSSANGSRINTNPASEGSLASRLNGGDIRSPVPRSDSTPASTLPLHMRMHNGNGVQVQTWMQPNNPVNTVGGNDPNGLTGPQSSVNDVAATGRLRIYAPGDIKPQQL